MRVVRSLKSWSSEHRSRTGSGTAFGSPSGFVTGARPPSDPDRWTATGNQASAFLLPPSVAPFLGVIAQVGVILYMFLVGLEFDTGLLRHRAHASVAVSHTSIIAPFLLGSALALWLYPGFAPVGVPFTVFALFMGVSLSVTAFPVLARILTDRGMQATRMGSNRARLRRSG